MNLSPGERNKETLPAAPTGKGDEFKIKPLLNHRDSVSHVSLRLGLPALNFPSLLATCRSTMSSYRTQTLAVLDPSITISNLVGGG